MLPYMEYGPYVCIGVVVIIFIILFILIGETPGSANQPIGNNAPPNSNLCGAFTESLYNWANITPGIGFEPITGETCIPPDVVCPTPELGNPPVTIDNTPKIPFEFQDVPICLPGTNIISDPNVVLETKKRGRFVSKGERMCCQTMEQIYGVPFSSVRPKWLSNPETKRNLELDCYNDELKIAVEYNGEQHYKWPNFTNQTYQQFINQVRRDQLKFELCDRNKVYLIVVPYNIPHNKISSYITSHLPETIQKRIREENIFETS